MMSVEPDANARPLPPAAEPAVEILQRPIIPAVRWGAIFAGVAAGVSVQLVLTLFGVATGLAAVGLDERSVGAAVGALLWAGVSMLVAAFVGGYVAARMSGFKRKADGVLHGLVSWAVATLLFATVAASTGGSMLGGIFDAMRPGAARDGSGVPTAILRSQIGRIDGATLQQLQQHLQAGRREQAIALLVDSVGMQPSRAERVVDQALVLSGAPNAAAPGDRNAAARAVESAGTAAWVLFTAVALALAVGIAGGVLGAIGARRTTWSSGSMSSAGY